MHQFPFIRLYQQGIPVVGKITLEPKRQDLASTFQPNIIIIMWYGQNYVIALHGYKVT